MTTPHTPIVFVHGNGDTAALWHSTLWRFESNGYPRALLHAIDFSYPQARTDDNRPMEGRSGTRDQLRELSLFIDRVRIASGAAKVALVASSRGANAVRNLIRNAGGAAIVSHAILAGGVNHGVYANAGFNPSSEFNGLGPFIAALNTPDSDGSEVTPGVQWLTLRSDKFDKYAQADGRFVGQPGMPTHMTFDGPALRGAENVVLPGVDHREVAFGPRAFAEMFRFLTGRVPVQIEIAVEKQVVLDGKLSGFVSGAPTNLPLAGAQLTVYQVDSKTAARRDFPLHRRLIGADGAWGPLTVDPATRLEFVIEADGCPITHIYRSPFPRSSALIHLRPAPPGTLDADDVGAGSVVVMTRPRGYLGVGRDTFLIDGVVPAGVTEGVPCISTARMRFPASPLRPVPTQLNDEVIVVRNLPARESRIVLAEFHY